MSWSDVFIVLGPLVLYTIYSLVGDWIEMKAMKAMQCKDCPMKKRERSK